MSEYGGTRDLCSGDFYPDERFKRTIQIDGRVGARVDGKRYAITDAFIRENGEIVLTLTPTFEQ